jgi:hypothetical protein
VFVRVGWEDGFGLMASGIRDGRGAEDEGVGRPAVVEVLVVAGVNANASRLRLARTGRSPAGVEGAN